MESEANAGIPGPFAIDETPLRHWILKAYHERLDGGVDPSGLVELLRELLSGPEGGPSVPGEYYFESDPRAHVGAFLRGLRGAAAGLDRAVFEPLLASLGVVEPRSSLPPNLGVFVASLSGPIALRSGLDETITCALLAAGLLVLSRLGTELVASELIGAEG